MIAQFQLNKRIEIRMNKEVWGQLTLTMKHTTWTMPAEPISTALILNSHVDEKLQTEKDER